jgi:hypothetical protein
MNDTIKKIGIKRMGEMRPKAWYEPCQKKLEYTKEGWQSHYTNLSTQWEAIPLSGDFHAFKTIQIRKDGWKVYFSVLHVFLNSIRCLFFFLRYFLFNFIGYYL